MCATLFTVVEIDERAAGRGSLRDATTPATCLLMMAVIGLAAERHFRLGRYLLASSLARRRCGLVLCPAPAQRTGPEVDVSFVAGVLEQLVIVVAGQGHRDLPR